MPEKSSVFDMIGPAMIGPSSSHTAGVVRIGKVAHHMLGSTPHEAEIIFYNSFAHTHKGHGSDLAILAGIMGYPPDDLRIKKAFEIAKKKNIKYHFKAVKNSSTRHPNSIYIRLKKENKQVSLLGESRGGGIIHITEVNDFRSNFSSNLYTLIIFADDIKGSIAFITDIIAHDNCNIATMSVSRKGKDDLACLTIEMDSPIKPITLSYIKTLDWIKEVIYIIENSIAST